MTYKQQIQVVEAVEAALGDEIICSTCGATVHTMADLCSADLDERCPGFVRYDTVRQPIADLIFGLK